MAGVQLPPLRGLGDFVLNSAHFALPDLRVLDRWNHRMINNLLYYQTNYFALALCFLLLVGFLQPIQLFIGMTVVTLSFLGFIWAAENQAFICRFRRNHPSITVLAILLASYFFVSYLGGVSVFLFGIAFPILMVLFHASVRLRNMKSMLDKKLERIGLTPMGILLVALGQEQEAGS